MEQGAEVGPAVVGTCWVGQLRVVVVVVLLTGHLAVRLEAGPAVVVDCGVGRELLMEVAVCSVTGTSLKVEDQGAKLLMMRTRLKVEEGGAQMMQFGIFAVTLTLLARPHLKLQT